MVEEDRREKVGDRGDRDGGRGGAGEGGGERGEDEERVAVDARTTIGFRIRFARCVYRS